MDSKFFDVIIIGAGPAGMTAAVFTARKGLSTLVLSKDVGGQVNWTTIVENYMGFKSIGGAELMERFEEQMKGDHLAYIEDEAAILERDEQGHFKVTGKKTGMHRGRVVIIATGKRPRMLNVPGEVEFRGKGVGYCSTCDAPLYRDAPTAVVGGGNSGVQAALDLLCIDAKEVHLVTDEELTADEALIRQIRDNQRVKIYTHHQVLEITGDKLVQGMRIRHRQSGEEKALQVEGVFIEIGLIPNADFLDQIHKNERREIRVNCQCRTNIEGVFAAGDVTDVPEKQIVIASGEGAKAAIGAWEYIIQKRVSHIPVQA